MVPDCSICGADVSMDEAVCFISAELYLMVRVTTDTAIKLKKRKSIFRGRATCRQTFVGFACWLDLSEAAGA
jgi:hypothetical protein